MPCVPVTGVRLAVQVNGSEALCANPDKVVEHAGRLVECGGALADLFLTGDEVAGLDLAPDRLVMSEERRGYQIYISVDKYGK